MIFSGITVCPLKKVKIEIPTEEGMTLVEFDDIYDMTKACFK